MRRISEAEGSALLRPRRGHVDRVAAHEQFVEDVRQAVWEPNTSLPRIRKAVAQALASLNKGQ